MPGPMDDLPQRQQIFPTLQPFLTAELQAPPSPRTHRALRRLQSAHSLGAKSAFLSHQRSREQLREPLLLQQQHQHQLLLLQQQQQQQHQQQQQQQQQQLQLQLQLQQHEQQEQPEDQEQWEQQEQQEPLQEGGLGEEQLQEQQEPEIPQPVSILAPSFDSPNPQLPKISAIRRDASSNSSPSLRQRGRANSDVSMVNPAKNPSIAATVAATAAAPSRRMSTRKPVFSHGHLSLAQLIRDGPSDDDFTGALETARWKVVDEGIKSSELDGMSTTRIYVWLILLNAPIMSTDDYLELIHRGPSPDYSKIRNDTFRTLTTDPLFRRRVSEASLIRLLNAVAWRLHDTREELRRVRDRPTSSGSSLTTDSISGDSPESVIGQLTSSPAAKNRARALTLTTEGSETSVAPESGTYVQGMNVLAAPFLYAARSEAEAFVAFHSLLTNECPGYIRGAMDGVHKGLKLVDKVLNIIDPKLSKYLRMKGMTAEIYAFPSVLTLSACTPPLPEVLRLWDFLFAYGPHLNIICIVAQLWRIRDEILRSPSPNRLLRSFPSLQADVIKSMTIAIIQKIPDDVYAEIVAHAQ